MVLIKVCVPAGEVGGTLCLQESPLITFPDFYASIDTMWLCIAKSQTQLSDFTFTFHFHALEKEMATHSSVLAWRIPGTEEHGGLPSMGSHTKSNTAFTGNLFSMPLAKLPSREEWRLNKS